MVAIGFLLLAALITMLVIDVRITKRGDNLVKGMTKKGEEREADTILSAGGTFVGILAILSWIYGFAVQSISGKEDAGGIWIIAACISFALAFIMCIISLLAKKVTSFATFSNMRGVTVILCVVLVMCAFSLTTCIATSPNGSGRDDSVSKLEDRLNAEGYYIPDYAKHGGLN